MIDSRDITSVSITRPASISITKCGKGASESGKLQEKVESVEWSDASSSESDKI